MTTLSRLRTIVRRTGFDIRRWPGDQFGGRRQEMLQRRHVNTVLDVGANRGQYARALRDWGYTGRVVSFEPLSDAFASLQDAASSDPAWTVHNIALGDRAGQVQLNVAANAGASSSVLPMLEVHQLAAPHASYVDAESVQQVALDSLRGSAWTHSDQLMLKIDVQGYERQVLAGASDVLMASQLVEIELSFEELYEGGLLFNEAMALLAEVGFGLAAIEPGLRSRDGDLLLQADGLFVRN